jgi:hypothetical protein
MQNHNKEADHLNVAPQKWITPGQKHLGKEQHLVEMHKKDAVGTSSHLPPAGGRKLTFIPTHKN